MYGRRSGRWSEGRTSGGKESEREIEVVEENTEDEDEEKRKGSGDDRQSSTVHGVGVRVEGGREIEIGGTKEGRDDKYGWNTEKLEE